MVWDTTLTHQVLEEFRAVARFRGATQPAESANEARAALERTRVQTAAEGRAERVEAARAERVARMRRRAEARFIRYTAQQGEGAATA